MQSLLCWAGHVVHMKDHHLPKKLLYGELSGQALPKWPEKVLQRHTEGLHEIFQYHP